MARYRRQRSNPGGILDNPRIFGADLRESAEGVAGIVAVAMLNDKVISPFTRRLTSGFRHANNTIGQLVDAGTTLIAAQGVGMLAGRFLGAGTGRRMAQGGAMYGAAKAITAFVPNVSLSAQYPDFFPGLGVFASTPAVGATASGSPMPVLAGGGQNYFTANPRPVAPDADVGY